MAANGSANKVIWTKLNAEDMRILDEGELSLEVPEGDKFSTSGLAKYRKSDDKIIYFFQLSDNRQSTSLYHGSRLYRSYRMGSCLQLLLCYAFADGCMVGHTVYLPETATGEKE